MPLRRRELELSVERPLGPSGPAGGTVRWTARFDAGNDGSGPSPAELKEALEKLTADLDAVVGLPLAGTPVARPDRDLRELVETYRPRQRELVDLLLADGEVTAAEHTRLLDHLARAPHPATPPKVVALPAAPLAAAPVSAESGAPPVRPVSDLLRTYQIASLKQAGAVRARRQISFAEYMALKRHFETAENEGAGPGGLR